MPREPPAQLADGTAHPRRLTYAPEQPGGHGPAFRLTPAAEPSLFPWEELARIRGGASAEPSRGEASLSDRETVKDPVPMHTAPAPPSRGDAATAFMTTPAVSQTAVTLGWTLTAVDGRPARHVPAAQPGRTPWRWILWAALIAFALYQI